MYRGRAGRGRSRPRGRPRTLITKAPSQRGRMELFLSSSSSYTTLASCSSTLSSYPATPSSSPRVVPPLASYDDKDSVGPCQDLQSAGPCYSAPMLPLLLSDVDPPLPSYEEPDTPAHLCTDREGSASPSTPSAYLASQSSLSSLASLEVDGEDPVAPTSQGGITPSSTPELPSVPRLDASSWALHPSADCRYAAGTLLQQIQQGLLGCTDTHHRLQAAFHEATSTDGNHYPLEATYAGIDSFSPGLGLATDQLRPNQGIARHVVAPPVAALTELFSGLEPDTDQPRNICLHLDPPLPTIPNVSSDVDSLLAFPSSLAAIRTEFYYCPTMQFKRRITTDVHLERTIFYPSSDGDVRQATLQLRKIPHLYLGGVSGIRDCSVYVFLPRLYRKDSPFTSLTSDQVERFTDFVFLDSILEHLPDATTQHIPPGFLTSQLNAAAQSNEMRTGVQDSAARTSHTYLIQAPYLEAIWDSILSRTSQANLIEFSDAFLCIVSKGHKLQFQGQDPFPTVVRNFYHKLATMFDYNFLDHKDVYIDVAIEICPTYSSIAEDDQPLAQVYLWKRCCLEKSLEALYTSEPENLPGTTQFYNVKFLSESCNMTHVPAKRSRLFQGGVRYVQYYAVEKEISDAGTVYPFSNPSLAELSLDPAIWQTAASTAQWKGRKSRETIVHSYCQSKRRVRSAYQASREKSFGVRAEYRVTSTLLLLLLDEYESQAALDPSILRPLNQERTPPFVWAISTSRYVDFVLGNVQKMCATIEAIMLVSPKEGIRQGQSYLLYGLLQCLRFFFSRSAFQIQPTLWYDRRVGEDVVRCGLGFEATLAQAGYCWFLPVVDWERLQIIDSIYPYFVVNPREILGFDWKAREARNASWQLDDLLELLPQTRERPALENELLVLLCHLCFRRFRQDVLLLLVKECFASQEIKASIEDDAITFCYSSLTEHFGHLYLVSGNRSKIQSAPDMFDALWGSDLRTNRRHFEEKPYRQMFKKATLALEGYPAIREGWKRVFEREFFTYHSILPLPDGNGTLISTAKKTGKRTWWSSLGGEEPFWGRLEYDQGPIAGYPASFLMSKPQLTLFLEGL